MSNDGSRNNKLWVIVGFAGLALLVALIFGIIFSRVGKVEVKIEVSPKDSTLTIDGQKANAGVLYISKGKHTLKVTRQHFGDVTKEIDTENLRPGETIYMIALANTPEAEKYLQDNPDEMDVRMLSGGQEVAFTQEEMYAKYGVLLEELPRDAIDYRIDYYFDDKNNIVFDVELYVYAADPGSASYKTQLEERKQTALGWLKDRGIDTAKAKINFSPDPAKL